MLTVEVDTRCNLRCTNCFALAALPELSSMEWPLAEAIAREGRAAEFRVLHLTGGEPMLWPHFFEYIELGLALKYELIYFNTNASLLNDERTERLAQLHAASGKRLRLSISVNGSRENHDATRGKGSYDSTMRGLRRALAAGLPVEVFTTIERRLLPDLAAFTGELFRELPEIERCYWIQNHRVTDDAYPEVLAELLGPAEFLELVRLAGWLRQSGHPIQFLDHSLVNPTAQRLGGPALLIPPSPAARRASHLCILRDGRITHLHSDRQSLAAFAPGVLQSLRRNPEFLAGLRAADPICAGCDYQELCSGQDHLRATPPGYFDAGESSQTNPYCRQVLDLAADTGSRPDAAMSPVAANET